MAVSELAKASQNVGCTGCCLVPETCRSSWWEGSGLHSGLMIPQYTAASLVSQNKQLCTPASVDSIPSCNEQEDHVSMGANAATKCLRVIQNTTGTGH